MMQIKLKEKFVVLVKQYYVSLLLILCLSSSVIITSYVALSKEVLGHIITASSIIVALITGYLFIAYFNVKQLRLEKLSRFTELQNKLLPYQKALNTLADQLMRKHTDIDFQLSKPYMSLRKDLNFWEKNPNACAIDFVRALYEVGSRWFDTPDFEKENAIISPDYLDSIYEGIIEANSVLSRRKHYKHVLEELGLPEEDFDRITIADDSLGMRIFAKHLPNPHNLDWTKLEFWYDKIIEATDILERMRAHSNFIYSFSSDKINNLAKYLLITSIFGVILPLITLSIPRELYPYIPLIISNYIINLSVVAFIVFFIVCIHSIYKIVTDTKLTII